LIGYEEPNTTIHFLLAVYYYSAVHFEQEFQAVALLVLAVVVACVRDTASCVGDYVEEQPALAFAEASFEAFAGCIPAAVVPLMLR